MYCGIVNVQDAHASGTHLHKFHMEGTGNKRIWNTDADKFTEHYSLSTELVQFCPHPCFGLFQLFRAFQFPMLEKKTLKRKQINKSLKYAGGKSD